MARFLLLLVMLWAVLFAAPVGATRPSEPLEAFDLTSLRYTGRESTRDGVVATVVDPTGVSHRVTPGAFLGKNHGRVMVIEEAKIVLIELYLDSSALWFERPAELLISP
ncbi:MAG: pilus assembly protein PilP [Pseudomarimonas sp.]